MNNQYNLIFDILPLGKDNGFKITEASIFKVGELIKIEFFWQDQDGKQKRDFKWLKDYVRFYLDDTIEIKIGFGDNEYVSSVSVLGIDQDQYSFFSESSLKNGYEIWFAPIGFDSGENAKSLYSFKSE